LRILIARVAGLCAPFAAEPINFFTPFAKPAGGTHEIQSESDAACRDHYEDPSQVIVVTGLPASFDATGGSLGVDVNFRAPVLWRTEVRGLRSTNAVWPLHEAGTVGRNNVFFVTALAPTF
jgi:hypothetical protein